MKHHFRYFIEMILDDRGAIIAEYALTLSLFSCVSFAGMYAIANGVYDVYTSDQTGYQNLVTSQYQPLP